MIDYRVIQCKCTALTKQILFENLIVVEYNDIVFLYTPKQAYSGICEIINHYLNGII